ncbi:DciA family protein [Azomonas macrocytogenes]|uniref:DUF721 domain-containing protein n=1 Tax=Azomonas macrocytogenes TaxID=69962 RepID=A0A839T3S1_AZOMA|nr:DciA family protein [Azomonas macrocytogenes]MBB3104187.1 hypothetical protein [Azomonas macrocytogenes]
MSLRPLPARTPAALLREARPLQALFSEARRLAHLQHVLEQQLQPAARAHCQVASWRNSCLLLIVSDGGWATRLRYLERRLRRNLQATPEFAGLSRIVFKVRPSATDKPLPKPPELSSTAANSLKATAQGIADPKLRAALERLASKSKVDRKR